MPNWCSNVLSVHCKNAKQIEELKFVIDNGGNLCQFFIPMPRELEDTIKSSDEVPNPELAEKYGADNWYDWQAANWDIKWGACEPTYVENQDPHFLTMHFDTPWCPSLPLARAMEAAGFDVVMYWAEFGMMFCGKYANGELSEYDIDESNNDCYTYNEIDETFEIHAQLDADEASY